MLLLVAMPVKERVFFIPVKKVFCSGVRPWMDSFLDFDGCDVPSIVESKYVYFELCLSVLRCGDGFGSRRLRLSFCYSGRRGFPDIGR